MEPRRLSSDVRAASRVGDPLRFPRWLLGPGGLLALLVLFLLAAGGPAHADAELVERAQPFDLPLSLPFPDAYLADAVRGSNGTLHLVVTTPGATWFLQVNETTGLTLAQDNLTARGFGDYYYSGYDFRHVVIVCAGGRVAIAAPFSFAGIDVVLYNEGSTNPILFKRSFFPEARYRANSWALAAVAVLENAKDPTKPSIAFARTYTTNPSYEVDLGRVDIDLAAGTVSDPWRVMYIENFTVPQYGISGSSYSQTYPYNYFDLWRTNYQNQFMAGVIDTSGRAWVTLYGREYLCSYTYYGSCYSLTYYPSWLVVSPTTGRTILSNMSTTYAATLIATLDALAAPDGTVALFAAVSVYTYSVTTTIMWAQVSDGAPVVSNLTIVAQPVTGAAGYLGEHGAGMLVSGIINGTGEDTLGQFYRYSGFPAVPVGGALVQSPWPAERLKLLSGDGTNFVAVAGTLRDSINGSEEYARNTARGASFGRSWPTVIRIASARVAATDVLGWQVLEPSPVRGAILVPLPGGGQVGAMVAVVNGTGRLYTITASGVPLRFTLAGPFKLSGYASSVRVISHGSGAAVVTQVTYPHPLHYYSYYSYYYACPTSYCRYSGYAVQTVSADGALSAPYSMLNASRAPTEIGASANWRLMPDGPFPLVYTTSGLFSIDPANGSARWLLGLRGTPGYSAVPNWTRLYDSYSEIFMPLIYGYGYCSGFSYDYSCISPIEWWTRGGDLFAALVFYNRTSGTSGTCSCVPMFRIAQLKADGTNAWFNQALNTGAANDTLLFGLSGDFIRRDASPAEVSFYIHVRQYSVWEREFEARFSPVSMAFTAKRLFWETPYASDWQTTASFSPFRDGAVHLVLAGSYDPYFYPSGTVAKSVTFANGSGQASFSMRNVTLACQSTYYYYWYYDPYYDPYYPYYYPTSLSACSTWTALEWNGRLGVLIFEYGRPRFFAQNHPPSAPHLLSPADRSVLSGTRIAFSVIPSVDEDLDTLFYTFTVRDAAGNLIRSSPRATPTLTLDLSDGNYTWTCTVTDGVVVVDCLETFAFTVDAQPPFVDAGGPYLLRPGEDLKLDASGSYDTRGIDSYSWSIGGEGGLVRDTPEELTTLAWGEIQRFFDGTSYFFATLTARDASGFESSDYAVVLLVSEPLTVTATVLTATPAEGDTVELGVRIAWGALSLSWEQADALEGNFTVVWKMPDGSGASGALARWDTRDSGEFAVEVTAVTKSGAAGSSTVNVRVANLPPTIRGEGPTQFAEGESREFRVFISDPSPVDAALLAVDWLHTSEVSLTLLNDTTVRALALTNGTARITAAVRDKDGGIAVYSFDVLIAEAADAVGAVWVAGVGATWADLRWQPTTESDFIAYQVRVWDAAGLQVFPKPIEIGAREVDRSLISGLAPETTYTFEIVVVAAGGVRSVPVTATATTAPTSVSEPLPSVVPTHSPAPRESIRAVTTEGADAVLWLLAVIVVAAAAAYVMFSRRRRED